MTRQTTTDWRRIATAPHDGTKVLLWGNWCAAPQWECLIGCYNLSGWWVTDEQCGGPVEVEATHWMPLPEPPMPNEPAVSETTPAQRPYERAVYEAVRALLRHGHFARLEIGPAETEGNITVGLHAGWADGQFVVMSHDGKTEWGLDTCDASVARELAAALTAYADWCDEEADAFFVRLKEEKTARAARKAWAKLTDLGCA